MCESDIPTLSDQVMEYLERMAKNETTAAVFLMPVMSSWNFTERFGTKRIKRST